MEQGNELGFQLYNNLAAYRNGYNGADLKSAVSACIWHVGSNPTAVVS